MAKIINLDAARAARLPGSVGKAEHARPDVDDATFDMYTALQGLMLAGLDVALAELARPERASLAESVETLFAQHVDKLETALAATAGKGFSIRPDGARDADSACEAAGDIAALFARAGKTSPVQARQAACFLIGRGLLAALARSSRVLRAAEPTP
jgi:hypothetical protein